MNTFVPEFDWVSGSTKWADADRLPSTKQCRLCLRDGSLSKAHDDESCQDSKDCGFEIPWMGGASVKKQRDRFALLGLKRPPNKHSAHGRIREPRVQDAKRGCFSSPQPPCPGSEFPSCLQLRTDAAALAGVSVHAGIKLKVSRFVLIRPAQGDNTGAAFEIGTI